MIKSLCIIVQCVYVMALRNPLIYYADILHFDCAIFYRGKLFFVIFIKQYNLRHVFKFKILYVVYFKATID